MSEDNSMDLAERVEKLEVSNNFISREFGLIHFEEIEGLLKYLGKKYLVQSEMEQVLDKSNIDIKEEKVHIPLPASSSMSTTIEYKSKKYRLHLDIEREEKEED